MATFCGAIIAQRTIKVQVAAAANLRDVLSEIEKRYEKTNPKIDLEITYGSSGNLTTQIINGAAFRFFLAANKDYPLKLQKLGFTESDVTTYVYGKLAMWSTSVRVDKLGLKAVTDISVKRISIANPKTAPYGDRSIEALKKAGLLSNVSDKIVYADNIAGAAHYAFTGNTEIGFIAYSQYRAPNMLGKGYIYLLPAEKYTPIEQACTLIKQSGSNVDAKNFMKYILGNKCNDLWKKYGYSKKTK